MTFRFQAWLRISWVLMTLTLVQSWAADSCEVAVETPGRSQKMAKIAEDAGLHYVTDDAPGFTRLMELDRKGKVKSLRYRDAASGKILDDDKIIERLNSLKVPPGYREVWFSRDPKSHIQATGLDDAGRKQYRYHPLWIAAADSAKFQRANDFGQALPKIRQAIAADFLESTLSRRKVLATIVKLLEKTLIRVGNKEYALENSHFGLTTFLDRHVKIKGSSIVFKFVGKSSQRHEIEVVDRKLAEVVGDLKKIPGTSLFQYLEETGRHPMDSSMVNQYIKEISGGLFTAKDFRTWSATHLTAEFLFQLGPPTSKDEAQRNIDLAMEFVSERLGNTKAVCRDSYVDPRVIEAYENGKDLAAAFAKAKCSPRKGLSLSERAVLVLQE